MEIREYPQPSSGCESRVPKNRHCGARVFGAVNNPLRELLCLRHYLHMVDPGSGLNESSLRQRLKRETAAVHQHLEDQLALLDPGLDVPRYLRVLERFYGFYVPVEIDVARLAA